MSNKEEAVQAKEEAEKKMQNEEFGAARRLLLKAQRLYPSLEKLSQMLLVCDVHCTAEEIRFGNEIDWYGILQIEHTADEEAIKKQYRKLALQLHPDKNKFSGAETAFKLITEARTRLTCHVCKNKFIAVDIGQATASINTHHSQPAPCQQQKDVPNWAVSTTAGTKFEENASSKKCEAENLQKTTNVSRRSSGKVNNKRRRTQVCKSYEDDVAEYGNLNTTKDFGCFGVYPRSSTQLEKKVSYNEPVSDDDEVGSSPKRAKVVTRQKQRD